MRNTDESGLQGYPRIDGYVGKAYDRRRRTGRQPLLSKGAAAYDAKLNLLREEFDLDSIEMHMADRETFRGTEEHDALQCATRKTLDDEWGLDSDPTLSRKFRNGCTDLLNLVADHRDPDAAALRLEKVEQVRELLDEAAEDDVEIQLVNLIFRQGHSLKEIRRLKGLPTSTAWGWLQAGLDRLRRALEGQGVPVLSPPRRVRRWPRDDRSTL